MWSFLIFSNAVVAAMSLLKLSVSAGVGGDLTTANQLVVYAMAFLAVAAAQFGLVVLRWLVRWDRTRRLRAAQLRAVQQPLVEELVSD